MEFKFTNESQPCIIYNNFNIKIAITPRLNWRIFIALLYKGKYTYEKDDISKYGKYIKINTY